MTRKKSAPIVAPPTPVAPVVPDEDWKIVQVASYMGLAYQTARNQMLQGIFGQSKFDPATRCLTVSANQVKRVRTMRITKRKKKTRRTA